MYAELALAGLNVWSGFQQADIIRQNGDLQMEIDSMNAKYARLDAQRIRQVGQAEAARYETKAQGAISTGRAAYASQGVQIGYGTAAVVESDNRTAAAVNSMRIRRNAENSAIGMESKAINLQFQGQMRQLQSNLNADSAQASGIIKAAGIGVNAITSYLSTGRGRDRDSGTNDKAWESSSNDVHVNSKGDGVVAKNVDENGMGWYSRGEGDDTGFYGTEEGARHAAGRWRPMSFPGNYYWDPGA